jgi:hypothetical protein
MSYSITDEVRREYFSLLVKYQLRSLGRETSVRVYLQFTCYKSDKNSCFSIMVDWFY